MVSLVSGSTIFLREMLKAEGLELNRDYTIIQNGPTGQRLASLHSLIVDSRWAEANSQLTVRYLKAMVRAMQ